MEDAVKRRRRRIALIIAAVLIPAAILAGIAWRWDQQTRQSERHDYSYEIRLSVNTTIEDVTLLLPAPQRNGTAFLADALANGSGYGVPPDWNLSIEEANGSPMLAIRAARMVPEYRAYPIPIEPGLSPTTLPPSTEYSNETPVLMPISLVARVPLNRTIDTRDPLASEPVFHPGGRFLPGTAPVHRYSGSVYTYTVPVCVRFTADQPASLSLQMSIEGVNSIWRGGWNYNLYRDRVTLETSGDRQGWLEGEGVLLAGEGIYY
ncbi:MAG: hypothetical protein QMD46_09750 [Methanomicrobiales archaeon]|nr:hypothetical protein [Methanomicrobiales archaeon]MDI6877374.1 hypothetical protein [Methanomicrobiales archaeon]